MEHGSPALQKNSLLIEPQGKPYMMEPLFKYQQIFAELSSYNKKEVFIFKKKRDWVWQLTFIL